MSQTPDLLLFDDTTFSDLMKDIYHTSKKKESQINILIEQLKPLVNNIEDATVIVPLLKEYLDVGVKNDEQLVKLAAVVQRYHAALQKGSKGEDIELLTEEEKTQLLKIAEAEILEIQQEVKVIGESKNQ